MPKPRRSPSLFHTADLVGALVALLVGMFALWPLPLDPAGLRVDGFFHDSHVWCLAHMADLFVGEADWTSRRIGFPYTAELRFIGWAPAVLVAPFQDWLGALGAYNLALLLSWPLAALVASMLFRQLGARPLPAAAGGTVFAATPVTLGCLVAGQLAKIQHWTLALCLLAVVLAARRWRWLPAVPLAALALGMTSPSYAMAFPLAVAFLVPAVALADKRVGPALRGGLAVGLVGAVFWSLQAHYDPDLHHHTSGRVLAFAPNTGARAPELDALHTMVAHLDTLVRGPILDTRGAGSQAQSFRYLGLPAVVIGAVALVARRGPVRLLGLAWLLTGAVLALGPWLSTQAGFVTTHDLTGGGGGNYLALPATILVEAAYPLARSGMYHRLLIIAGLGAGLLVSRFPRGIAWGLCTWVLVDLAIATRPFLPVPVAPPPADALLHELYSDGHMGAVLSMPLQVDDHGGGVHLMLSTRHGRPTSALPRDLTRVPPTEFALGKLALAAEAPTPADARALLKAAGYRYVLHIDGLDVRGPEPGRDALEDLFGTPRCADDLCVWHMSPSPDADGQPW